jgi:hypothetical protein
MNTQFTWISLMRSLMFLSVITLAVGGAQAQHLELGAFASYEDTNVATFPQNAFGVGGRLDVNIHSLLQAEFEMAYDFKHAGFALTQAGASAVLTESKLGILHGNAGLKLQSRGGSFFVFVKGGANRYDPERSTSIITGSPVTISTLQAPAGSFTKGILYPGGGIGFHAGPLGIRLDAGDEIYWNNGAHHNLRVTFGPTVRF